MSTISAAQVATIPAIPGAIAAAESVYTDMSGANAALTLESYFDEILGAKIFLDM